MGVGGDDRVRNGCCITIGLPRGVCVCFIVMWNIK